MTNKKDLKLILNKINYEPNINKINEKCNIVLKERENNLFNKLIFVPLIIIIALLITTNIFLYNNINPDKTEGVLTGDVLGDGTTDDKSEYIINVYDTLGNKYTPIFIFEPVDKPIDTTFPKELIIKIDHYNNDEELKSEEKMVKLLNYTEIEENIFKFIFEDDIILMYDITQEKWSLGE